ncbi:MAG: penicillin-binding protein 2 [Nitriliruptoraceae bacterium]
MTRRGARADATPVRPIGRHNASRVAVRRIRLSLLVYLMVMAVSVAQLVSIQVVNADEYAERGARQRERVIELPATRGRILDRQGDVLATSVDSATVYADPRRFRPTVDANGKRVPPAADAHEVATRLAPLVGRDRQQLVAKLREDRHFVYLGRQLDWDTGQQIRQLELDGIGVLTEPRRVYPGSGLAAQVVGFTDIDSVGLQGIEQIHNEQLRGNAGTLVLERTPAGLDIASGMRQVIPSTPGRDVVLTIDRDIQHAAEAAASKAMIDAQARAVSVVVLDVDSFDVLAMASTPGFDPNDRREADRANWRNRAVTDVFEPGSSQKALTIAAAIEEGLIAPTTQFSVADRITVSTDEFTELSPRPTLQMSVEEIMERSSNVGTILIAQELGEERLDRYLRAFGYGSRTALGFPGESAGLLRPHEQWWGTSLPTIAIGHGVAVTLMQLAAAYGTLANDGVAHEPRLLRGTVGSDGVVAGVEPRGEGERVVSAQTAQAVRSMLVRAVEGEHATGSRARVEGYSVGGKTGTARKVNASSAGYSDQHMATFVGFAPADNPRIVVAVMVDEPTPIYGGLVAAPVFSEVMEVALTVLRVAPDRSDATLDAMFSRVRNLETATSQRTVGAG